MPLVCLDNVFPAMVLFCYPPLPHRSKVPAKKLFAITELFTESKVIATEGRSVRSFELMCKLNELCA